MTDLVQRLESVYDRVDQWSGGLIGILRQSVTRFTKMRGSEAAAGLAYYALFSLFPLTLLLAALLGYILSSDVAYARASTFIRSIFPFSGGIIDKNLQAVFKERGAIGIVGLLGLLWAASGYFTVLANGVNLAWPKIKLRGFVQSRLVGLAMMGALFLLLLLSLFSTTLISLLPYLQTGNASSQSGSGQSLGWIILIRLVSALFTYLLFLLLYRWVPNKTVPWKPVLIGSLVAAIAWEAAKLIFAWYLSSGLARYATVYGSLGTLIALLVWIYFSNLIFLFGAYLVASLELYFDLRQTRVVAEKTLRKKTPQALKVENERKI